MKDFINNKYNAFYHITTKENQTRIEKEGLYAGNKKGISVIRINDERIFHSIMAIQLYSMEEGASNEFVLLKISPSKCNFKVSEIVPDKVDEWTWPFHNNILREKIDNSCIRFVSELKVGSWAAINIEENRSREAIIQENIYKECFKIVYENNRGRKYTVNEQQKNIYL